MSITKRSFMKLVGAAAVAGVVAVGMSSCGGKATQTGGRPLEDTYASPCEVHDDDEWFAATGSANGSRARRPQINVSATNNAQRLIAQKIQYAFQATIASYMEETGGNQGTDILSGLEDRGNNSINVVASNARTTCGPKCTEPDAQGHIECFVAVKVRRSDAATQVANNIADLVSEDDKERIREGLRSARDNR